MFQKEKNVLERNKNTLIKQLLHAFKGNSQNHLYLGAVDDLIHCCMIHEPNGLGQQWVRSSTAPRER